MCPQVDVQFVRLPHDPSVEASVQRWVDRLGWFHVEVERAWVSLERAGWRRTSVDLTLILSGGEVLTTAVSHADVYVAVADAFRAARKRLLGSVRAPAGRSLAAV